VDVADLHAGAVTGQTARAQRRQTTLVRQAASGLFWSMNCDSWRGAEELLDRRHDRADVDQGLRRDRLDVLGRHALAHHALHAGQARADLVLDELAHAAHAAVAEVVDVVGLDARNSTGSPSRTPAIVSSPRCRATRYLIVATMSSSVRTESCRSASRPSFG
jgi:hypothetical protein